MEYCIVNKIENINNVLTFTAIGYITNIDDCNIINENYDSTLGQWFIDNLAELENETITISDFFNITPHVYNAKETTNYIKENSLDEITDITTLL